MRIVSSRKTAVLLGATGLVGQHLLEGLLANKAYHKVIAPTRRSLRREEAKLDNPQIDFNYMERYRGMMRCDDLFIALGTTIKKAGSKQAFRRVDYEYIIQAASLAKQAGANQCLFVSSAGADAQSRFFYNRVKGQTEAAVVRLDFWATHIFRPGVLLGEREERRPVESLFAGLSRAVRSVAPNLLGNYNPTEADLLAKRMIQSAQSIDPGVHVHGATEMLRTD